MRVERGGDAANPCEILDKFWRSSGPPPVMAAFREFLWEAVEKVNVRVSECC
jgi:hypothetical protein